MNVPETLLATVHVKQKWSNVGPTNRYKYALTCIFAWIGLLGDIPAESEVDLMGLPVKGPGGVHKRFSCLCCVCLLFVVREGGGTQTNPRSAEGSLSQPQNVILVRPQPYVITN